MNTLLIFQPLPNVAEDTITPSKTSYFYIYFVSYINIFLYHNIRYVKFLHIIIDLLIT